MKLKQFILALLIGIIIITNVYNTLAQCTNTTKYPPYDIVAPQYLGDTITVSTGNYAGDYYTIKNLTIGETYLFMSSASPADYLTIRDEYGGLLAHGTAPLSWTVSGPDIVNVHINLVSPPCGTEANIRTTKVTCTTCPAIPPGVGVGTTNPQSDLEVNGRIKLSDSNRPPSAGEIRWNDASQDFEGYNGNKWVSLTKGKAKWGTSPTNNANENAKLTASDGANNDQFGYSVSISGDYAVIGALYGDIGGNNNQGSAYIFHRSGNTWSQQAKLTASDGATGDGFGKSVAISGDYAVIGAFHDDGKGSAYIFHRSGTTWSQQAKLTASDGADSDWFGSSVSISGDYAVIGARYGDIGGNNNQGSAYIFHRSGTTWSQQAKLIASDGADSDWFGSSVSISGDYVVIGADAADGYKGSAYIFHRSGTTWSQQAKLTASDGAAGDYFGESVSISGDYAVIGARYGDIGGNNEQGSAYIFHRLGTTWSQQAKLIASDGANNDQFGYSVSISGDYAVIGALYGDIGGNNNQGSAYIFHRSGNTWSQQAKLTASDGAAYDIFGSSVSISGDYVVIGADGADGYKGSAYIFEH